MTVVMMLAACSDSTGPGDEQPRAGDRLAGAAGDPAVLAIPRKPFVARPEDYSTTHPQLPGLPISFNTFLVTIDPNATVGEVNAVLEEVEATIAGGIPGVPGQAGGILILRAPITSHAQMETLLTSVRAQGPVLRATQDVLLGTTALTKPNGGTPPWTWNLQATGDNWGLEASRVPQMWNLNAAVRKSGATTTVGVIDAGFAPHDDLAYDANATPAIQSSHGTHVAGTIAATVDNGKGVDGVSPFARLAVWGNLALSWAQITTAIDSLIRARPDIRVINMSVGYNWYRMTPQINPTTSVPAQNIASVDGAFVADAMRTLTASGVALPVIVAAAGNDSNSGMGDVDARFASPFAAAALQHGIAAFIVVESDSLPSPGTFSITRSGFSNLNGHVSAPGSQILSTDLSNGYGTKSGTSMATPLVTGLVSYIYALDPTFPRPTLTANPMRELLTVTAVPVNGGAQPRVDAFAAALRVDVVLGGTKVLRKLVDIDDGTVDGNTRLDAAGAANVSEDADGDGGPGDGDVDMSDFRRWRDWLLQAEDASALALDGAATHPKKDLNGDTLVEAAADENIYPRGDFNGDGLIHRTITRAVPGALANAALTDLQVLQQLFSDADYQSADLPGLINSADLEVRAATCLALPGVTSVQSSIRVKGTPPTSPVQPARTHTTATANRLFTLPLQPAGYTALVEARNSDGIVVGASEQDFSLALGSDARWTPVCGSLQLSIVFPATVSPGVPVPLDILVEKRDPATGNVSPAAGAQVSVIAAGGTVSPASGVADGTGKFLTNATLAAGNTLITLLVTATLDGATVTQNVSAASSPPPSGPLEWRFDTDLEGWSCSSSSNCKWQLLTSNQNPETSGWVALQSNGAAVSRTIAIPSTARFLRFGAATHNVPGDISRVQVQVGGVVVLDSVFVNPGSNTAFNFVTMTVDISSRAGQTVNIRFVQLDDGAGDPTTLKIDNIRIEPD
ncbi:MAG TPA: S8 family serine peptidase [Gemmatimonadaceae bacterium]